MDEIPPSPARATTTLYSWAERLLAEVAPRSAALLLGLRWSFGLPHSGLEELREYSLPLNPTPIREALEERGGVRIIRHAGDTPASLYEHLTTGKPALVASDVFYFPFRPAYRRVHHARLVLVRRGETADAVRIEDGWAPAAEGVVARADLERARYSPVPLDVEREPLFSGTPLNGEWFEIAATLPPVDDPAAWARALLVTLHDEMSRPRSDQRGAYGISAFRRFQQWLEKRLDTRSGADESLAARRAGTLLLRPELSSRLYFDVFVRNAAHLLEAPQLMGEATQYRRSLGHLQAAMDVLTKTIRLRRPAYDELVRRHLDRAIAAEERLIGVLTSFLESTRTTADAES